MKKKALCLLLAMIMVLSILAGCTSKPLKLLKRLPSPPLSRRPFSS